MAGRDTPMELDAGGDDPETPPPSGADILSSMPEYVLYMEILPHVGAPDNQDRALVQIGSTNRRLRGIVENFLTHAPDSYLANLSWEGIRMLQSMLKGSVRERLQRYMDSFPGEAVLLFDDEQPGGVEVNILDDILADPDRLQHRYYRDLIWRIIDLNVEPMRPARPNYVPLLRLMHLVGVSLDGVLSQAIEAGQVDAAQFALDHSDEEITQNDVMHAWRHNFADTAPDMFQFIVANINEQNVSPMIIHAVRFYADLRAQPGHDEAIQILEEILDQRFSVIIMYQDSLAMDEPVYDEQQFEADVQRIEQEYADMFEP
jgi:hypothetical protein